MGVDVGLDVKVDAAAGAAVEAKLKRSQSMEKAAEGFEAYFLTNMLKEMSKTTQFDDKKSFAEETEMSIFYEKVGEFLAKKGVGIKDAILRYLSRNA